jgi:hypothetical protein
MDAHEQQRHARRETDVLHGNEGTRSHDPLDPRSAHSSSPVDDDMNETAGRGSREWNRREWAGEEPAGSEAPRWNKNEWAGEPPDPGAEEPGGSMPEGESGPTGLGHNPGEQHWAGDRKP